MATVIAGLFRNFCFAITALLSLKKLLLERSMKTETFQDFYKKLLSDALDAENQLIKALPKMAKAASSDELRSGFAAHLEQTREHVVRIEQIFQNNGEKARRTKCKGMEGLVEEGAEVIEEFGEGDLRDAALICAAQKAEHYEIASYATLRTLSQLLGDNESQSLLEQILQEEGDTDAKLTQLSASINPEAIEAEGQEAESEEEAAKPRKASSRTRQGKQKAA
jgi:ferritin-like metal-binding protein YciE